MNRKRYLQLGFLAFLIIGTVLIIRQQHATPYQRNQGMVFGTFYTITYQSSTDMQAEIEAELRKVDNALSPFNDSSVISGINRGGQRIAKSEEGRMFLDVFQEAMTISKETGGAFDITVAPLVNLWGFGFREGKEPTRQAIDSIRHFVGYDKVEYRAERGTDDIIKSDSRIMLDCSAIAKGYGCDVVARLLRSKDIQNFMVEIGGEVVTSGISEKRIPWRIGVTKPTDDTLAVETEYQTVLNVTNKAMATSGNYRNFYYKGGKKYAHTIDPKTGYPVQHSILSATVLASSCATADAYATAFMVMGMEGTRQVLDRHPELMAYLIYTDEKGDYAVWYSPSMKSKILE